MNETLRAQVMKLSPAEKIELAQELWDSLGPPEFRPLTTEQMAEIDRRIEEHDKNPDRASTWEEVQTRLRARFK